MSSNLLKSYYVKRDQKDARLINTNELVEKKIERIRMIMPMQSQISGDNNMEVQNSDFYDGLDADKLTMLTEEMPSGEGSVTPVSNIIKAEPEDTIQEPVYEGPSPEELIEQAQVEIEQMRSTAKQELAREREEALEEAKQQGYEEGKAAGLAEAGKMKERLEQEKKRLEAAYEEQIDELEPEFVRVLTDIYEKIFEVNLSADKNLIVALLRNSMKKIEGCKNYLVHISRSDYEYVSEHKEELLSDSTQEGAIVDVIEDVSLKANECMIETPNGIFDCGLGTQLSELKKKLELLSYESNHKDR